MRPLSNDTDAEAEAVQLDLLRRATPTRRAGLALSLTQTVLDLSRRALLRREPGATGEEIAVRLVSQRYGEDLGREVAEHLRQRRWTTSPGR